MHDYSQSAHLTNHYHGDIQNVDFYMLIPSLQIPHARPVRDESSPHIQSGFSGFRSPLHSFGRSPVWLQILEAPVVMTFEDMYIYMWRNIHICVNVYADTDTDTDTETGTDTNRNAHTETNIDIDTYIYRDIHM